MEQNRYSLDSPAVLSTKGRGLLLAAGQGYAE